MKQLFFLWAAALCALTGGAQDAGAANAAPSVSGEPLPLKDAVFFVKTEDKTGIAFLMEDQDGVWMVSSGSVFDGTREYNVTNANGESVAFPDQVEVSKESNLIRFRTDRPAGLRCAASCRFEEGLRAFSRGVNTDEDEAIRKLRLELSRLEGSKAEIERIKGFVGNPRYRVRFSKEELDEALERIDKQRKEIDLKIGEYNDIKKRREDAKIKGFKLKGGCLLDGEVVALGPDRIEISAPVSRHDSGGPVVNKDDEVIGVSSYLTSRSGLPEWVVKGTRFEDARRFALKTDGVEWMTMTRKDYQRESSFVWENVETLAVFAKIAELLHDDYFRRISINTDNRDVREWIDSHNRLVKNVTYKSRDRKFKKDLGDLVEMVRALEKNAGRVHRVSVPFYQEQLADLEDLYRVVRARMELSMESL